MCILGVCVVYYDCACDAHIATLTVRETIFYSAWVRLPEGTPKSECGFMVFYVV